MACCGQGRMALRASLPASTPATPRLQRGSVAAATTRPGVPIRYLGAAPIVVRGGVTGRAYAFAAGRAVQLVDPRDVSGLIRKGLFRPSA